MQQLPLKKKERNLRINLTKSVQKLNNKNYNSTEEYKIKMKWKWKNICFWMNYQTGSWQESEGTFKEVIERTKGNHKRNKLGRWSTLDLARMGAINSHSPEGPRGGNSYMKLDWIPGEGCPMSAVGCSHQCVMAWARGK